MRRRPALGHDLVHHDAQVPTCTEIGWDAYDTCSRCDYTTYAEKAAMNHDIVHHEAQAPTCTEIGWEAYDSCSREGCGYTTYAEIPALKHDWKAPLYTWSDDNRYVTATLTCKNNGEHHIIETANTTFNQTKAPTYFAKGETTYTATFTNALFARQTKVVDDIAIKEKDPEVKAVEAMIGTLNDQATLSDKDKVNAARVAYQKLTDEQKQLQVSSGMLAKSGTLSFGHAQESKVIVETRVLPGLIQSGADIAESEKQRLLYYIEHHEDHLGMDAQDVLSCMGNVSRDLYRKLMLVEAADSIAYRKDPDMLKREEVCLAVAGLLHGRTKSL